MTKKVLIIGGGVAGFSTAIAMQQRDIDVEIVELHRNWRVYHVGIIVQSNFGQRSRRRRVCLPRMALPQQRGW